MKENQLGFARSVFEVVQSISCKEASKFVDNFRVLMRRLSSLQRAADREISSTRVSERIKRSKQAFLRDWRNGAKKEHAVLLFEEIESVLEDTAESDAIRTSIKEIYREFGLRENISESIPQYTVFQERLERLNYSALLEVQDNEPLAETVEVSTGPSDSGVLKTAPVDS